MKKGAIALVILLMALPFLFQLQGTEAAASPLTEAHSGLIAQDSLTSGNLGYWTLYGDAVQEHAPYSYGENSTGLHIGIQAAKQGKWAGFYAESPNTSGELFHAVLTLPYSSIPSGDFNTGLYVQTAVTNINYVSCTADVNSAGYDWSVVYTTGNSRSAQKFYQVYYQAGGPGVPLTRDCTIITNGQNVLEVYLDGQLVYSSSSLKLQMPSPFDSYLEVESTYGAGMLFGTYADYYAAVSDLIQVGGVPPNDTAEVVNSSNTVLASALVGPSGSAVLDVGRFHMPISGSIRVYDPSGTLVTSTAGTGSFWGGDAYQENSASTTTTSLSSTSATITSTSTTTSSSSVSSSTSTSVESSSSSTTTTTSTTTSAPGTLTVESVDQNSNPIYGYYITLYSQSYKALQTGYTTVTFKSIVAGTTYIVEADGYISCSFDHWQDTGSADYQRTFVAAASGQTFVAVYACA